MNQPLIVIVGPTATGKSDLAIKIAESFNGEIVSADSWTIRRYMDIGTAKPSPALRNLVPHHLIDVIEPDEDFNVVEYKKLALEAINSIHDKGKIPILVGGSGLYVDAVIYDYSFLPPGEAAERSRLNLMSLEDVQKIAIINGLDLSLIDEQNKRRVIRLIESKGESARKSHLRDKTLIIGLQADYDVLKQAIVNRVELMIEAGLEEEVRGLMLRYGWDIEALKGIGYSEWRQYFSNKQTVDCTKDLIIRHTLALAKKQQTWFKRNKSIQWFITPVKYIDIVELITTFIE